MDIPIALTCNTHQQFFLSFGWFKSSWRDVDKQQILQDEPFNIHSLAGAERKGAKTARATPLKFNSSTPQNWWLEDYFPSGPVGPGKLLRGELLNFQGVSKIR